MKHPPEPLTDDEMNRLLTASSNNLFYNTLFQLARNTGRRLGEFYGVQVKIKIGEVETDKKKKVYTNEGKQIEVPIKKTLYKYSNKFDYGLKVKDIIFVDDGTSIMKTWILKRRNFVQDESIVPREVTNLLKTFIRVNKLTLEDHLFHRVGYRAIQKAVQSYGKKANINKNVSFHSFRHFFITDLLKKGWSHDKIKKITGHKSIMSISSYDHVLTSDLKKQLLEDLDSQKNPGGSKTF